MCTTFTTKCYWVASRGLFVLRLVFRVNVWKISNNSVVICWWIWSSNKVTVSSWWTTSRSFVYCVSSASWSIRLSRLRLAANRVRLLGRESRLSDPAGVMTTSSSSRRWRRTNTFLSRVRIFLTRRLKRAILLFGLSAFDEAWIIFGGGGTITTAVDAQSDKLLRRTISRLRLIQVSSWIDKGRMTDLVGLNSTFFFGRAISGK